MKIFHEAWESAVGRVLDLALTLVIRTRRTLLPPKPIVWHDPRPYRLWDADVLRDELAMTPTREEYPEDSDEQTVQRALMLEEILARRGQKAEPQFCGDA